jgi:hypothetical protein
MKTKHTAISQVTTWFLKASVLGMSAVVILFCVLVIPVIDREWPNELPHLASWRYALIFNIIAAAILFFVAASQVLKLLSLIDANKAFSRASVKAMKNVKYCGLVVGALSATILPLIYFLADSDDAPGLILIYGIIFVGMPMVLGVFAGVAQALFQNAIAIKSENDLTV